MSGRERLADRGEVEAAGVHVEPNNGCEHEDRGDHGVQEELYGSVNASLVSVHADDQRHRDQRGFPEDVEEEEVERYEDAEHRRLKQQHEDEEFFYAPVYRVPLNDDAEGNKECGQYDQPKRNPIDTEVIVDVGRRHPNFVDCELEAGTRRVKVIGKM